LLLDLCWKERRVLQSSSIKFKETRSIISEKVRFFLWVYFIRKSISNDDWVNIFNILDWHRETRLCLHTWCKEQSG
jgi:hypothetical protein